MDEQQQTRPIGRRCAACGHLERLDVDVCGRCGRSVVPPRWTPGSEDTPVPVPVPASRGAGLRIGLLGLTLVVIGAIVLANVLPGDGDESPTATPSGSSTSSQSPTPTPTPTPTPSPSPPPTGPVGAECWDGSTAVAVSECPAPTGRPGLAWVFPTSAEQDCTEPDPGPRRVLLLRCVDSLADGTEVVIAYSQWTSVQAGIDHFEAEGIESSEIEDPSGAVVVLQWAGQAGDLYEFAGLYADEPYSVAAFLPSSEQAAEVATVAAARPAPEVRGVAVEGAQ